MLIATGVGSMRCEMDVRPDGARKFIEMGKWCLGRIRLPWGRRNGPAAHRLFHRPADQLPDDPDAGTLFKSYCAWNHGPKISVVAKGSPPRRAVRPMSPPPRASPWIFSFDTDSPVADRLRLIEAGQEGLLH